MTDAAPRLRVLMTTDAVGGVWTYALHLARGLAARGVATHMAVTGPMPSAAQVAQARRIPALTLHDAGVPLDWMASDADEVRAAGDTLGKMARSLDVGLVHLNSPAYASCGAFSAPVLGVTHSCLATWWAAVHGGPMPRDFAWRSALVREGLLACDALVAPTRAHAAATAAAHALPRMPVGIHNGGDAPSRAQEPALDVVFTAGRLWDAGKNIAALDRVAQHLPFPVQAAGPLRGPEGSEVRLAHVTSLGTLDGSAMRTILRGTPLYAAPALYEPFGLAVLEAAQSGCALCLSDIPTFRELWDGAAIFLDWSNEQGAACTIRDLMGDPLQRSRFGEAARHRASGYSLAAMADATIAEYRSLLAHAGERASAA
ncbi:MAG: glycosyltransferase family 4 protein [Pseudomonadota bacterium]